MKLVIVHHHFRPGGVRRVIELGAAHLVARWPDRISAVVLATGEAPDAAWLRMFRRRVPGVRVTLFTEPAFGYASEVTWDGPALEHRAREGLLRLVSNCGPGATLVWAHNLGLGRNLYLSRELATLCHRAAIPLVAHHHDWWFENRWHHFAALDEPGFRRLPAVARAILPDSPHITHAAINAADAAVLGRFFPGRAAWLPNPVEPPRPASTARLGATRRWLKGLLGEAAPVWLLPCRLLRRKNIAEALLLTRWLRPEAWLVSTGGASSAEEERYARRLAEAARLGNWRLRLGVLQGDETTKPSVPELFAASEAVLLTSLHEGFGLPYLEAAAAGRPLVARQLPQIAPDLRRFGFRFPQAYHELLVDPVLFDWQAERERQARGLARWKDLMPPAAARLVGRPPALAWRTKPGPVPFSRLTLTAQLEVLSRPPARSWERCVPLNCFLRVWRERAQTGRLKASAWPAAADGWLGAAAYARRFIASLTGGRPGRSRPTASLAAQRAFIRVKVADQNLYPLLWNSDP